jgi:hypothetical protein
LETAIKGGQVSISGCCAMEEEEEKEEEVYGLVWWCKSKG